MSIGKSILFIAVASVCLLDSCAGNSGAERTPDPGTIQSPADRGKASLIGSVSPLYGAGIPQNSTQKIACTLRDGAETDSVVLTIGNRRIAQLDTAGYVYHAGPKHPTGRVVYRITAYRGGKSDSRTGEFMVYAAKPPVLYGHQVRKVYPHSRDSYTQGLLWHDGFLYESTGLEGHSSLRKVDLGTGQSLHTVLLDGSLFGEGLALLGGKLYQLTWQNNKALVYDLETFEKVGEFDYGGEGWGLASDGKYLYQSDGTEKIHVLDPATFKRIRTLEVCTDQSKVPYVNEMEWIKGELWANVYTTDTIIRIDPETGAVLGVVDMAGLLSADDLTPSTDVLNGIAYDPLSERIFVTGKNWNKLFEVAVIKK